jgi:hypothetical protein
MPSPRFSVLLPTHDRADVVGCAIRSVLGQSDQDFEILVVGDGCTDETGAVISGFGDPRIRWFDLPKAPFFGYANRNIALREARGELIAFMAHDDLLLPDHLHQLGALFDAGTVEWAYSRPAWVADDGVIVPFAVDLRDPVQLTFFLEVGNSIPASCVMYRKTCLDRYGYWPEDVPGAADWEHWRTMIRPSHGANIAYLPAATALHFRANWRDPARWGPAPLHRWLGIAADTARWPRALQTVHTPGEPSQVSILRAIEVDPVRWTDTMRDGIARAMDLLAWAQGADLDRIDEALGQARTDAGRWQGEAAAAAALADESARAAEASERAAEVAAAEAQSARVELDALCASRSWRLTAPLRRTRATLRR